MNWYILLKVAMPVVESPNYVGSYFDIGHSNDAFFVTDERSARNSQDIQLWGIDPQWNLHVKPAYSEDHGRISHGNLSQIVNFGDEFMMYGRFERNDRDPDGIVSVTTGPSFSQTFTSLTAKRYAIKRVEKILDQKFGHPKIVFLGG